MSEVRRWLEDLGLGRYATAFKDNDIDFDVLRDLTELDLAELGVSLGDRKRLMRAIVSSPLGDQPVPAQVVVGSMATHGPVHVAERRQLTVLFCDLVGSTSLSSKLDPEDLCDTITIYRETCARVIDQFGGFIARYAGDGIVVYFGYPKAHEDEAERAVRTGLGIVQAMAALGKEAESTQTRQLAVRVGIATGLVVVGDLVGAGTTEQDAAVGYAPNIAARLQSIAQPNSVVINIATKNLLGGLFEYENLGIKDLKGLQGPSRFGGWFSRVLQKVASRRQAA